jgi:hypothetical protein
VLSAAVLLKESIKNLPIISLELRGFEKSRFECITIDLKSRMIEKRTIQNGIIAVGCNSHQPSTNPTDTYHQSYRLDFKKSCCILYPQELVID